MWAPTRLCETIVMASMDQQRKLARPAHLTTTHHPNVFSKFYVYRIDCNFRVIKIPARSEGTCVADAEANYFSSFAGQKNYVMANLIVPILLELGKAARRENRRDSFATDVTSRQTKATDAVPDGEASTEHYAAFAGKPQYVISNLFLPLLLKLQTKIEQQAKHSKKIVKVSSDSLPFCSDMKFRATCRMNWKMGQERWKPHEE